MQPVCGSARSGGVVQMASDDLEMRVRAKLELPPDQQLEWCYTATDFSPVVRHLIVDGRNPVLLGQGNTGYVE